MIAFEGTYTRDEWLRGLGAAMRLTRQALWTRLFGVVLFLAAVALMFYPLLQGEGLDGFRLFRGGVVALLLGYWALSPFAAARRVALRQWNAAGGQVSLRGKVTDEGIATDASPEIDRWDRYEKAVRREDMIVLLGRDGQATILPRRFFPDDRSWQDLQTLVASSVRQ